jgi:hypothetical protein
MAIGLTPKAKPRFRRKDVAQDPSALQDSSKDVSQDSGVKMFHKMLCKIFQKVFLRSNLT